MEIIAILMMAILELTVTMVTLLIPAILELVALIVQLIAEGLFYLGLKKRAAADSETTTTEKPSIYSSRIFRFLRRSSKWTAALCMATLGFMLVVQFFFLPETLGLFAGRIERETNSRIEFDDVTGNLFTGEISIHQLRLKSITATDEEHDLQLDQLDLNIDYWESIFQGARFQSVSVNGVRGTFTKLKRKKPREPRFPFVIEDFRIDDVQIDFRDQSRGGEAFQSEIIVDSFRSENFQSQLVLYEFMFNSQIEGTLGGHPFSLKTSENDSGRKTIWTFDSMPVTEFSYYLSGPFESLSSGTLSVQMNSQLTDDHQFQKQVWDIHLEKIRATIPKGASLSTRLLALPIVSLINSLERNFDLQLKTELAVADLHGESAYDATKLSEAFKQAFQKGLTQQLATQLKEQPQKAKAIPGSLFNNWLKRGSEK
ncbi:hypothetical protein Pla110_05970 [Polystyrenella longa]|uniref:DUF748 domain-containing protein n=1 Tax=Polystyrenella longa TaxID=2528007 RepID=A0A518CI40_9PLAN|nr:hypothetical protein [Polystyrenella longa]QDU78893.1 hypothetical protein Pla110_05970 [Polystyrenella longa]